MQGNIVEQVMKFRYLQTAITTNGVVQYNTKYNNKLIKPPKYLDA
jgi:hypothetical protein